MGDVRRASAWRRFAGARRGVPGAHRAPGRRAVERPAHAYAHAGLRGGRRHGAPARARPDRHDAGLGFRADRKSTRLNSSDSQISYAVFCLKKKKSKHGTLAVLSNYHHLTLPSGIAIRKNVKTRANIQISWLSYSVT